MELISLPAELLDEICSYLTPTDIFSLSHTCQKLRKIAQSDHFWGSVLCFKKFGITILPSPNRFAHRFYHNVFQIYGTFIGFWEIPQPLIGPFIKRPAEFRGLSVEECMLHLAEYYQGVLQIAHCDGQICGFELPRRPTNQLPPSPKKLLFSISMDEANKDKAIFKNHCSVIHKGKTVDFERFIFNGYRMMVSNDRFGSFVYDFHRVEDPMLH